MTTTRHQVCGQEAQLYYRFFRAACPALHIFLEELCSLFYESLRASVIQVCPSPAVDTTEDSHRAFFKPRVKKMRSLEALCNLKGVLATESANDSMISGILSSGKVEGSSAVRDLISRLSQDASERLYFITLPNNPVYQIFNIFS